MSTQKFATSVEIFLHKHKLSHSYRDVTAFMYDDEQSELMNEARGNSAGYDEQIAASMNCRTNNEAIIFLN